MIQTLQYMKFGQNPSFASRDTFRVQTRFFGQNLKISKCWCDPEHEVKVTKIYSLLFSLPVMRLRQFGQNPLIVSGDRVQTRDYADADGIRTKSNMSPSPSVGGTEGEGDLIMTSKIYQVLMNSDHFKRNQSQPNSKS